eukprot:11311740-Ditylum_brightwellii.AAC.1
MAYINDDIYMITTCGGADLKDLLSHNLSLYLDIARVGERYEINVAIPSESMVQLCIRVQWQLLPLLE